MAIVSFTILDAHVTRVLNAMKIQFASEIGKVGVETDVQFAKRMVVKFLTDIVRSVEATKALNTGQAQAEAARIAAENATPPTIT
jgi:hypothetical protein